MKKILVTLNVLVTLFLFTTYSKAAINMEGATPSQGISSLDSWMKYLNDDATLEQLSIPGTHDSATSGINKYTLGSSFAITQTKSLTDQFRSGIRYVDIRTRAINNAFTIHHGSYYCQKNFEGVLEDCNNFLEENPTETIFMRLSQEKSNVSNSEYNRILNTYLNNPKLNQNIYYGNSSNPTIKDMRKKIVIIRYFQEGPDDLGLNWYSFDLQDDWTVADTQKKFNKVKDLMETANNTQGKYINHLSGTMKIGGLIRTPKTIAKAVNNKTENYLKDKDFKHIGIIVMDFPSDNLVKSIINYNAYIEK